MLGFESSNCGVDVVGQALEAVDLAPRRLPAAEIGSELVGRRGQRLEPLLRRRFRGGVVVGGHAGLLRFGGDAAPEDLVPRRRPAAVGTEFTAQRRSQLRSTSICPASFGLERVCRRQGVVVREQRRQKLVEFRQIAVERRGEERVDREVLLSRKHLRA